MKLTSRSFNPNCCRFLKIFSGIQLTKLKKLGICQHVESSGLKRCRQFAFEFVQTLESLNPRTNYLSLFSSYKMKSAYETWKSKQSKPNQSVCSDSCCQGEELSVNSVFGQEILQSERSAKQNKFFTEAVESLCPPASNSKQIQVHSDFVNFEMAVMHFQVIMPSDNSQLLTDPKKVPTEKVFNFPFDSEIRERLRQIVYHLEGGSTTKTSTDKGEGVVLQLFKDGLIDIRLTHRNTDFCLRVKGCLDEQPRLSQNSSLLTKFSFSSCEAVKCGVISQQASKSIEIEEVCQRKFSVDSSICEFGWSNTSTAAGSETDQVNKPRTEVLCNLSGEIAFEVGPQNDKASRNSPPLKVYVFLIAQDKASTSFLQLLPDIKHLVNTALLESFFMLAMG